MLSIQIDLFRFRTRILLFKRACRTSDKYKWEWWNLLSFSKEIFKDLWNQRRVCKKSSINYDRLMRQRSDPASNSEPDYYPTRPKSSGSSLLQKTWAEVERETFLKTRIFWLRTRHAARVCTWYVFSATNASSLGWRIAPLPLLYSPPFLPSLAYQNIHLGH